MEEVKGMRDLLKGKDIVAYSDGASFNDQGPAGSGVAFFEKNGAKETYLCGAYHSFWKASNNYAEYFGLILAQTWLMICGVNNSSFKTDSKILFNDVHCNKPSDKKTTLFALKEIIINLFSNFEGPIQLFHVHCDLNQEADTLSKKAIEARQYRNLPLYKVCFPRFKIPSAAEISVPN
jgi:ribonuclease HI